MKHIAALVVFVAVTVVPLTMVAQNQRAPFQPVTDAMLEKPDPANWPMWRRTLDSWGYSPLDQVNRSNVNQLRMVWSRAMGSGNVQEATPLVYDGVMYVPNPNDYIIRVRGGHGQAALGVSSRAARGSRKYLPFFSINRNLAIYGTTIIDTSADDFVFALDAQTGKLVWETKILDYHKGAQQSSGPIIANGKVISGRGCEPEGGPDACVITAHDARTGKELWRTRTIPAPGEPGDETWGGVPFERRYHVGTWMVPSYDPELNLIYIGTSVTVPGAEVPARRQRQEAPLPQLHAGAECRHRQDRLVLPAHRRSLGPRSSLRAPARRYRRRAERERGDVDQPALKPGERKQGADRHSGQDRHRLHAGSPDRRVPLGTPTVTQNVVVEDRWRDWRGHGESGDHLQGAGRRAADLPEPQRRQELAGRRLQPADQHDVHAAAEHVHDDTVVISDKQDVNGPLYGINNKARLADGMTRSASCRRSRPRPARPCGSTSSAPAPVACRHRPAAWSSSATRRATSAPRRQDRQGAVGGEPRHVGERLPDHFAVNGKQ